MLALSTALGVAREARADEPSNRYDWAFRSWGAEIALTSVSAATALTGFLMPQNRRGLAPDAAHAVDEASDTASWGTLIASGALLFATVPLEAALRGDDERHAVGWAFVPVLVEAQAVLLAEGTTEILKHAIGRCRPRAWDAKNQWCPDTGDDDDFAAFPSGHTSLPSALAGSRLVFALRSKGKTLTAFRWINFGVTEALAIATGGLRVTAGAHSITDVLGGWAVGHLAGVGVALMHPMGPTPYGSVAVGPGNVTWSGAF